MIISNKLKTIFIHIQKTGGTSIDKAIQNIDTNAIKRVNEIPATHNIQKGKHLWAIDLKKYLPSGIWDDYFKFAFIRNPWDRLVSWYYMCVQKPENYKRLYIKNNFKDFSDFLINGTKGLAQRCSYNQVDFITNNDGEIILDFIGRFENYNNDIKKISSQLGVELDVLNFNKSEHEHYRNYYTEKTKKIVEDRFMNDIKCFNYHF
ncbi:Carbohydrate sulfotransferase, 8-13 [Candidatus Magnetomorum sp. HK-1]|nr:Carbohydrate sulfotransferase, 8-13 [Candidatus Magnetomorum sp. HK-1]